MIRDALLFKRDGMLERPYLAGTVSWMIVLCLLASSLFLVDYIGGQEKDASGKVDGRIYTPAYVTTIWHSDGKGGGFMQTIYHPEEWRLSVDVNGELHQFVCSEDMYNYAKYGSPVKCTLVTGCISGIVYSGILKDVKLEIH